MPAQISTTCRGRLGVVYRRHCSRDGFVCQGWYGVPAGGGRGVGCGDGLRWDIWHSWYGRFAGWVEGVWELGKSSMCWSGVAQSCRRAGTKIVCSLWISSQRDRPALLATKTKSTGHLAGGRRVGGGCISGGTSVGVKRRCRGAREARMSMFAWERMSSDRHGVSSHLGRTRRQRKGEAYAADSSACLTACLMSVAMYSGFATHDPVHR
jgi:hypothetical protein